MLKFIYESGNDEIAVSEANIIPTLQDIKEKYNLAKEDDTDVVYEARISQLAMVNTIGNLIYQKTLSNEDVELYIESTGVTLTYSKDGTVNWFGNVPPNH